MRKEIPSHNGNVAVRDAPFAARHPVLVRAACGAGLVGMAAGSILSLMVASPTDAASPTNMQGLLPLVADNFTLRASNACPMNVTLSGLYDAHECGSDPVNWVKAQLSALDPADPSVAAKFEQLLDLYWTDPDNRWCSPAGQANTGWGHDKGLMYFALYDAGRIYRELEWSGVYFSDAQAGKFRDVLLDAISAAASGTFYYFGKCDLYAGKVNIDNSCGEDDESISKFLALIHNLYPEVVALSIGEGAVESLEQLFFEKAFSTDYEHGGGLLIVDGEVTFPNHGGSNWPYAAVNLTGVNNARDTYLLTGKAFPDWYRNPNVLALFNGLQLRALSDGSAFTNNCVLNNGTAVACNDPGGMNAVPGMLPAGRFIRAEFGDDAFTPSLYTFEECNLQTISDPDRANQYCSWDPGTLPLRLPGRPLPSSSLRSSPEPKPLYTSGSQGLG